MKMLIPEEVQAVLTRLHENGYEAYLVGGCVRDSLRGVPPKDWDVTTSALPQQTLAAMDGMRVLETGLRHGTVTVMSQNLPVEVTTYRVDGEYTDHRRPDSVAFTRSLDEDLMRRDFTINALAYCGAGVIDRFGGQEDLQHGLIRCVGNPDRRFEEDALRILRGLRFASELGFSIHPDTAAAMERRKGLLCFVAAERVCSELTRLLCGRDAGAVLLQYGCILDAVLPEIGDFPSRAAPVQKCPLELPLRLAALLNGSFPDAAGRILHRLRFDRHTSGTVVRLLQSEEVPPPADRLEAKRMLQHFGPDFSKTLLQFQRALSNRWSPDALDAAEALLEDVLQSGECWSLSMLTVNGGDLLRAGIPHGKALGTCLQTLLSLVMDGTLPNDREVLLAYAVRRCR